MCLHFWHIYHLSPSYILIAPERITVPLRVRRTPRCFTRTLPMRGKVSNQMQTHSHTNQTNNYPSKELKPNQYHREKNRKIKKKTRAFEWGTADVYTNMNEFLLNHTFVTFQFQIPQYNFLHTQSKTQPNQRNGAFFNKLLK